ncbi:MAG: SDR family NAD(P)-dependent oxidoreductase, partial [Nocardioidaceae bacterium]
MELSGTAALITGGRRIGAVVAEELARRGVDVALSYARSQDEADQTAARVRARGCRAAVLQADLSEPAAC